MARPRKFNEQLRDTMLKLYAEGKTDAQVAKIIGVSRATIFNWKGRDPELLDTIKESKSIADDLVEASLFARATGYKHKEEKIFTTIGGNIIRVPVMKHYPPDVTAGIFWLTNRQPDRWKRGLNGQLQHTPEPDKEKPVKKTFVEFCTKAGYPEPFAKQIEMMKFGIAIDDPRILLGSRGYGKTDYVTVLGTAYAIYENWFDFKYNNAPLTETNLIISKSRTRNTAMIEEIGAALTANGVPLEKQNSGCLRVQGLIGKDHSAEVLTIKSSFRGRHPIRIIMDDPVTEEDTSEAMRLLVKKKYDEAYKLCKNIVIIGQPAHQFDLYAELRPQLKKLEVPHGTIKELDADLEAMKLAGVDATSIEMSYHLRVPASGSSIFANIKYADNFPNGDCVAFIDPSDGGDYTAISIIKGLMDGVVVQGHVWKKAWFHCLDDIVPILKARGVKKLCFETNCTGSQPIIQLRQLLAPLGIGVTGKHSDTNKHAAIEAAGSYAHQIYLSKESDKTFIDHVVKYEYKSKFDDAPDSMARCLEWLGLIRGRK